MPTATRGRTLGIVAVLFALLALSNFLKPFHLEGSDTGFVFFGRRLSGTPNAIVGPLFGVYLLVYAAAIWRMQAYALLMAWAYAAYVIINLILFNIRTPQPDSVAYFVFGVVYSIIGVGVSLGTAIVLTRRKGELL